MSIKPHSTEEEYFAREEALKRQKLAAEQARKLAEEQKKQLKELHWMHCPKCGMDLQTITYRGVEIDRCFGCNGVWLDEGELEKLATGEDEEKKGAVVRSILNLFGSTKK
ncbi:MAG: zf-TFIIB domain-containing protein [Myxococcales bacterium]